MLKFVVAPKATKTMPISPVLTYEEASNIKVLTYEEASNINKTKIRGWGGGVGEMKEVSSGLIFCPLKKKKQSQFPSLDWAYVHLILNLLVADKK